MYSRVCCFKGFDQESFAFNTRADPALFERQFEYFRRLLDTGMDLYGYVTLTGPRVDSVHDGVQRLVDRLQSIDERLPLRTIPLEIRVFTPVERRLDDTMRGALDVQWHAVEEWQNALDARFAQTDLERRVSDIPIGMQRA